MNHLKNENLKKCFSLLREYLDETPPDKKKRVALLALNQLQKITAGTDSPDSSLDGNSLLNTARGCHGKPRAYSSPIN